MLRFVEYEPRYPERVDSQRAQEVNMTHGPDGPPWRNRGQGGELLPTAIGTGLSCCRVPLGRGTRQASFFSGVASRPCQSPGEVLPASLDEGGNS
jgi:hypothetical protein